MFEQYTIIQEKTILDALKAINAMDGMDALTLFVINLQGSVIGTLTDGDIRRSLLCGYSLDTKLSEILHENFCYLPYKSYDIRQIHEAKSKGIELIPVLDMEMKIVDLVYLKKQKSYLPVDAVLMAGGKGERLRPMTDKTPKPMLRMNGKPIIDYIVEHIILYGVKNISVTVNYLKEQIEEHYEKPFNGIKVRTVREPKFLGTIGSLRYVEKFENDTVLLMNSDAITDINLEDFFLHHRDNGADMSVAAVPYSVSVPYGIFDLESGSVMGIQEKPTYNYYANTGIYLIKRELIDLIPADEVFNATEFMELLVGKNYRVVSYPFSGTWMDIGNQQDYRKACDAINYIVKMRYE